MRNKSVLFISMLLMLFGVAACQTSQNTALEQPAADNATEASSHAIDNKASAQSKYKWQIANNVPQNELTTIQSGIKRAENYFQNILQLSPTEFVPNRITMKIVATGKGDQESSSGSCCVVHKRSGKQAVQIFLDVAHPHWVDRNLTLFKSTAENHQKIVIHELVHAFQYQTSRNADYHRKAAAWITEGIAEYIAYDAMIRDGKLGRKAVEQTLLGRAVGSNQMSAPLKAYHDYKRAWPGHVGALVIAGLLKHTGKGPASLAEYTRLIGKGRSHDKALRTVYGISAEELYSNVEAWRQRVDGNPQAQPVWSR